MISFASAVRKRVAKMVQDVDSFAFGDAFKERLPVMVLGKGSCPLNYSIKTWETSTDSGGSSNCSYSFDENLVFKGEVVFDHLIAEKTKSNGGYVALRGLFQKTAELNDYEGFEITMKCNAPVIVTLNVGCESLFVSDLFQFHIRAKGTDFTKYHVKFSDFMYVQRYC